MPAAAVALFAASLRTAVRRLLRAPGYALTIAALVAAVIALNASVFAALAAMRFKPLPYSEPDRLLALRADLPNFGFVMGLSEPLLERLQADTRGFTHIGGYAGAASLTSADGNPLRTVAVSADLFATLGVRPALGRAFDAETRSGVVISDALWRRQFGADPAVLGRPLTLAEASRPIVGVMPAGFQFPDGDTEVWSALPRASAAADPGAVGDLEVVARLAPGTTPAAAGQQLDQVLASEPALEGLRSAGKLRGAVWPLRQLYTQVDVRALYLLQLAAVMFLLLAAANLSNLVAARSQQHAREWLLRVSLGASRRRLALESALDAAVPTLLGTLGGLSLVPLGTALLRHFALLPADSPIAVGVDGGTLAFAALIATGLLLLCATVSLLVSARPDQRHNLKSRGAGRRISAPLLVLQIGIATGLLGFGALLLRSATQLLNENPGFDRNGVAVIGLDLARAAAATDSKALPTLQQQHADLLDALRALPGVERVAASNLLPFASAERMTTVGFASGDSTQVRDVGISRDFFAALRIPLLAGDGFASDAVRAAGAADEVIVDARFMRQLLPQLSTPRAAIGASLTLPSPAGAGAGRQVRIVGVVADIKHRSLDETEGKPTLYQWVPDPLPLSWLLVRSGGDAAALLPALSHAIARQAPDAKITLATTLAGLVEHSLSGRRDFQRLIGGFAFASLLLTALGLYAALAFAVRQRAYEWSVRAALGARATQLLTRILAEAGRLALIGVPLGIAAGAALARIESARLHAVGPFDTLSWAGVALAIVATVLAASLLPALRAARADPAQSLREA